MTYRNMFFDTALCFEMDGMLPTCCTHSQPLTAPVYSLDRSKKNGSTSSPNQK